jgi:hypothetical protein
VPRQAEPAARDAVRHAGAVRTAVPATVRLGNVGGAWQAVRERNSTPFYLGGSFQACTRSAPVAGPQIPLQGVALIERLFEDSGVTALLAGPPTDLPPAAGAAVAIRRGWRRQHLEGSSPVLPVLPELAGLLPSGGLRRGSTVAVLRGGSLLLALLAGASRAGIWCGVLGWPEFGALAAAELGVVLERVVAVPDPGGQWVAAAAALLDGADLVLARPPPRAEPRDLRRLAARARDRRAVLLAAGDWPGAGLRLSTVASRWSGLDGGAGHLLTRELTVRVEGRGAATRPQEARITLPAAGTDITPTEAVA